MVEWQIPLLNGCKMYQLKYATSLLRPSLKNVVQKSFLAKIRFKYHEQPVVKFEFETIKFSYFQLQTCTDGGIQRAILKFLKVYNFFVAAVTSSVPTRKNAFWWLTGWPEKSHWRNSPVKSESRRRVRKSQTGINNNSLRCHQIWITGEMGSLIYC